MINVSDCSAVRIFPGPVRRVARTLLLCVAVLVSPCSGAADWTFTVKPGDNPWTITRDFLKNMSYWGPLQEYNHIGNAHQLRPGSRLKIPVAWLRRVPASVMLAAVAGRVEVQDEAASEWSTATPGQQLGAGARIRVGSNGSGLLQFADGSEMAIMADTEIVMDRLSAFGRTGMVDTRIRLQRGRVETRARPMPVPEGRFEIQTPTAVTAVRGTVFRVSAEAAEPVTRSEVARGKVEVLTDAAEKNVPAGFGLVARADEPLSDPKPLLPASLLAERVPALHRMPDHMSWPPVKDASAYRLQISDTRNFQTLAVDKRVETADATVAGLTDGRYFLRVRAIDSEGLEGLDAIRSFVINARPPAPRMATPADGEVVSGPMVNLHWSLPDGAQTVRVEFADNAGMATPVISRSLSTNRLSLGPLSPGTYYWRLTSVSDVDGDGPAGDIMSFRVDIEFDSPRLSIAEVNGRDAGLYWTTVPYATRYQVQIASRADVSFTSPVMDRVISVEELNLSRLASGQYRVRVRALGTNGSEGKYSEPGFFSVPPSSYWPVLLLLVPLLL